jgi:carboxymethylenebutenolidase
MSNDDKQLDRGEHLPEDPARREFVALTAAAGLAARAGAASAAATKVEHKDVEIQTGDGTCDAAFFYPASGTHPGVIIWTDIFGLRPTFHQFGQRLAAAGYAVLIPNPFYRRRRCTRRRRSRTSVFRIRPCAPRCSQTPDP